MRDEIFKALEARWHELYDQYEAIKAALPPVVRWEWAKGERYDPRPFYFKRHPLRGRISKEKPENFRYPPYDYHEYGFDNQNRVIFERGFFVSGSWETFYRYASDKIEIVTFTDYKGHRLPNVVERCSLSAGKMQHYASLKLGYGYGDRDASHPASGQVDRYTGGDTSSATAAEIWERLSSQQYALQWRWEHYQYEKKLLVRIENFLQHSLVSPWESVEVLDYDNQDHLQAIVRTVNGLDRWAIYRKREPGETQAILAERAKTKLIEAIPQIIAKAQITETLYCLRLNYYSDGVILPPTLIPGFESYRQRVLRERHPQNLRDGYVWWDFDNSYPPLPITDPDVLEACENLNADIHGGRGYGFLVRTLRQIARELNKLDWSKYAPVTPDFIVYDCDDTEDTRPAVSLRYSGATKTQLADWRKRGLL